VNFLDANLTWVAPEFRVTGEACLSTSWHFWPKRVLSKVNRKCISGKEMLGIWISCLIFIPEQGHTALLVHWVAVPIGLTLLTFRSSPHSQWTSVAWLG
jgi:hypothetical protein